MSEENSDIPTGKVFDPAAKSIADRLTTKQSGLIFAHAGKAGVDAPAECRREFGCEIRELSKQAAAVLIERLQKLPQDERPLPYPKTGTSTENRLDLFAIFELDRVMPAASAFEPIAKRAAFADPENPLIARARQILAMGGVSQRAANVYIVNAPDGNDFAEFSVVVSKTGGPKCDCPDFERKASNTGGEKFRCEHIIAAHMFYREIAEAMRS